MACEHGKMQFTEYGTSSTTHYLEDGKWLHNSEFGDYTGTISVKCYECDLDRYYYQSQIPEWLDKMMKACFAQEEDSE